MPVVEYTIVSVEPRKQKYLSLSMALTYAPSEHSVQPGHPPSLMRVSAVHFMSSLGPKPSSGGQ